MTCRICQKPLSLGTMLFGCHFCGAFPVSRVGVAYDADGDSAAKPLKCLLCLAPNDGERFLSGGCDVCGEALGLFDEEVSRGAGIDALGFPEPSAAELVASPPMKADYERFIAMREAVLDARRAFAEGGHPDGRELALTTLQERWKALQQFVHEVYGRADFYLKLQVAAAPDAPPEEVARAAEVLLHAMSRQA
jgi:hypothetical protein